MKKFSLIISIFTLLLIYGNNSLKAGDISENLQNKLNSLNNDDIVKVWIKLYRTENARNFKDNLALNYKSRQDRHREALNHLKNKHATAQKNLLNQIKALNTSNKSKSVKSHWIVNVIEAELTKSEIMNLSLRSDVERIYDIPKLETVTPVEERMAPAKATGIEQNLTYIKAPTAWANGFTGQGRLVCSFDTGVDGLHPALMNGWKGHDGDSAAAWFDPADNETYPHVVYPCGFSSCNQNHGTHTLGIMVGHDDVTGDTVGVAPGAKWIAAAIIDIAGVSIVDAFEWAADPDGNPNTIDDVPDVINHSWGVKDIDCQNIFYDLIENTEALGIVNIFSAGNDGSTASSIRNPADRAMDSLDCFAVGNLNHTNNTLVASSSRGPSLCPFGNIKPNVVAPGYIIRSCWPNNSYRSLSGTSMASPHVAGLVALLRQKNPNATVDEIKKAILLTTNNIGQVTPNNNIGWGAIDCMAALNYLSGVNASPNVRVYSFDHAPINAGDTVVGSLVLKNLGAGVNSVSINLVNSNSALTILNGTAAFGTINEGDTVRTVTSLRVAVDDTVKTGSILSLDMNIIGSGGYTKTTKLHFLVEPKLSRSILTHNVGNTRFTITNFGTFGLGDDSFFPAGGVGFGYKLKPNDLFEGGLMIGQNFLKVSDGVRNGAGEPDGDFAVIPGGNLELVNPKPGVTEQSRSAFSDSRAESPNNIEIIQNSYVFDYDPYKDFVILQYIIKNTGLSNIGNLYVGLYMDWDIPFYSQNVGGYDATGEFAWIAYNGLGEKSNYRGVKVIHGSTVTAFTQLGSETYYSGDGFTETEKINALTNGFGSADTYKDTPNDLFQVVASKLTLPPGESDTVAFAILASDDFTGFQNAANSASIVYAGEITDVKETQIDTQLPGKFRLHQNYPNPFNPSTTISFELPKASEYALTIYNMAGQRVEQFEGSAKAGTVELEWQADNFASGIYLYKITTPDYTASKKMVLLK